MVQGAQKEIILPSYMGSQVRDLYEQQLKDWERKGIEITWERMCDAFKRIVGQPDDIDQGKALDEFTKGQVVQLANMNLSSYKLYFEHKLMVARNVSSELAVRYFINGLGSKHLRAACQPELDANRFNNVEEAYLFVRGQERRLAHENIKPFGGNGGHMQAHGQARLLQYKTMWLGALWLRQACLVVLNGMPTAYWWTKQTGMYATSATTTRRTRLRIAATFGFTRGNV
jgi:hypothetical protein